MLIHAAVDLQLIQTNSQYQKHCDRFQSFRCKHIHQRRVHKRDGLHLKQFEPFFEFAGNRPIHGGALIAPNAIPDWVRSLWRDPNVAWEEQKKWIWEMVHGHPQITYWDVVNELWPAPNRMRSVPWAEEHDEWWIDEAFHLAREANPSAKLFIKEFRPQDPGRWRKLFAYVGGALDRGVPIDGIAVQLHSNCYRPMLIRDAEWVFKWVKRLGVRLICDETIGWDTKFWSSRMRKMERLEQFKFEIWQRNIYRKWRELCESYGCEMFGVWCPSDQWRDTWHLKDMPLWADGAAYWRLKDVQANPKALEAWERLNQPKDRPFKQECTPGLWRKNWSEKPVLSVFPELTT